MMDSPPLCVVDANILIDLHIGRLLREFFRLPFQVADAIQPPTKEKVP